MSTGFCGILSDIMGCAETTSSTSVDEDTSAPLRGFLSAILSIQIRIPRLRISK